MLLFVPVIRRSTRSVWIGCYSNKHYLQVFRTCQQNFMRLKTNKLLVISLSIIGLTFLVATFWEAMGLSNEETIWLAFTLIIAFTVNIAGLYFSFREKGKDKQKSRIGLIGHLTLIIGFFAILGYALMTMNY